MELMMKHCFFLAYCFKKNFQTYNLIKLQVRLLEKPLLVLLIKVKKSSRNTICAYFINPNV